MADILFIRRNDKYHRFEQLAELLGAHLQQACGVSLCYTGDFSALQADRLPGVRCILLLAMPYMDNQGNLLPEERAGLEGFVRGGGGLVVLHSAAGAFNAWPAWGELAGGIWNWGVSAHEPYGRFTVHLADNPHPVARLARRLLGADAFETDDELYHSLTLKAPVTVIAEAWRQGRAEPQAWAREVGRGRSFFCALGHDERSVQQAGYLRLVEAGVRWAGRWEEV